MPDTAPTLITMAPLILGGASVTRLKTLRIKECECISVPARQLRKIGVEIAEVVDYLTIAELRTPHPQSAILIETHDDYRIGISFAVLGCVDIQRQGKD
jgi:3-phosphoshikimate 1-carboxyvinyltransferase